jgi:S-DNA-T family DNA segregation ATPase FtsK/SpoIIIE
MTKRKKHHKNKGLNKPAVKHSLPIGFWSQIGAVFLLAVSVLFVVAWFNAGGPVLEWLHMATIATIGYSMYVVPVLFVYVAIEIFRAEDNRLPFAMKLSTASAILWFSSLFGLLKNDSGQTTGGFVGDIINKGVLALVNSSVAAFIYILFIVITLLFILRVSPLSIIKKIWELSRRDTAEHDANVKVMRNVAALDSTKMNIGNFKLNAGVPTLDQDSIDADKRQLKRSGPSGSFGRDRVAEDQTALVTVRDPNWEAPSLDLLEKKQSPADAGDIKQNAAIIKNTLNEFDIDVEMEGANIGPRVTQFTLRPPSGVKLTRITALETNIALNLAAQSLRIEAPIPGKSVVGIEVPNRRAADVRIYSVLSSPKWDANTEPLAFAIGKDIAGDSIVGELNKMPHLLIAGQTGSGKSVMINTLLISLLYRNSPSEMRLILVDPKRVEMAQYQDIPHLLTPIITEPDKTISALKWAVNEMERRYHLLAESKVKDIKSYNQKMQSTGNRITVADEYGIPQEHENGAMPYIVIVVDELADLMMAAARDVEALIVRLAQKARAVGIHLVLATQSPRADIITGLIKANISARIAFTVASQLDSRIILDQGGAEKLLGQGDMLYVTASMSKPKRIQGAWVTDEEMTKVTNHLHMQAPPQYNDEVVSQPVHLNGKGGVVMDFDTSNEDDMYKDAVRVVIEANKASASLLQRRLRVGYARAARLIENMEDQGIIGPADGARSREVLISSVDELGGSSINGSSDDDFAE